MDMRAAWDSVRLNAVTMLLRLCAFCSRSARSVPLGGVSSLVTRKFGVANSFENALIIGNYQQFGGRWLETFAGPAGNMTMLVGCEQKRHLKDERKVEEHGAVL